MRPERAAQILAEIGLAFLAILLLLRGLSLGDTLSNPPSFEAVDEKQPYAGDYSLSPDGKAVFFRQGLISRRDGENALEKTQWYRYRLNDSILIQAAEPEVDIKPFVSQNRRIFLLVGNGTDFATGSPDDMMVLSYSLSPDSSTMAFTAYRPGEPVGLFILYNTGQLDWLGNEENISSLTWSPDGLHIAFIAPRDGVNQIFRIDRTGRNLEQVTSDPGNKSFPVWIDLSETIAYLARQPVSSDGETEAAAQPLSPAHADNPADPPEENLAIFLFNSTNPQPALLAGGLPEGTRLRGMSAKSELAFSAPTQDWAFFQALYLLDPRSGESRRIYPPYNIQKLECPAKHPAGSEIPIKITISNASQTSASLPLVFRAGQEPISYLDEDRTKGAQRIESIDLEPVKDSIFERRLLPAPGLHTFVSVLTNLGSPFPMSEKHCVIANTFMGLPNLDFLSLTFPLAIPGLLLVVPWLRRQKKKWLWSFWPAYIVFIGLLVVIEVMLVQP